MDPLLCELSEEIRTFEIFSRAKANTFVHQNVCFSLNRKKSLFPSTSPRLLIVIYEGEVRWFLVNTDRCGNPGLHWTVFYFPRRGPAEFFDSLGNPLEHYHRRFKDVLMANGPRYMYLTDRLQALDSNVCGQYCIYYIQQRSRGRTMKDICRDFRKNRYVQNDAFVYQYVNK